MADELQVEPPARGDAVPSVLVVNDREGQQVAIAAMLAPLDSRSSPPTPGMPDCALFCTRRSR